MSNFNFNNETISDFASIASSIHESYFPEGQVVIRNTSYYSKDFGNNLSREKTLSSTSLSRAMSGDSLYRSPVFSQNFYNATLVPSLNSVFGTVSAAANTTADTYKIDNPEDGIGKTELKGGSAIARHYVDSIAGKKAASDFVVNAAKSVSADYSLKMSYPDINPNATGGGAAGGNGESGTGNTNPDGTYTGDSSNPSSGARVVVVDSALSAEEKGWLLDRSKTLKNLNTVYDWSVLVSGFEFDVDNNLKVINTTGSHYPGLTNGDNTISKAIIDQPKQRAYICPVMIELLLYLNSKIEIRGGFGMQRGANPNVQGPNNSPLKEGGTLTDHALGRAFDIDIIGPLNQPNSPNRIILGQVGSDRDKYLIALKTLLEALSSAPLNLIPDHFAISKDLAQEFGVQEGGFEPDTCKIKTLYPAIKYANFSADATHRSHIHISFSGVRSGIYTGPGGQLGGSAVASRETPSQTGNGTTTVSNTKSREMPSQTGSGTVPAPTGTEASVPVDTTNPTPSDTTTGTAGTDFATYHRDVRTNNPFEPKGANPSSPNAPTTVTGDFIVPSDLSDAKFSKDYSTDPSSNLTKEEVYALMRLTVMSDEIAAIFASIAAREGGARPRATNVTGTNQGGDWSGGMFQCNLLPAANGSKTYNIPLPSPVEIKGWQIAYKDWQKDGVNLSNFNSICLPKAKELEKGDRWNLFDSRMWIPINQAYIVYTVACGQTFTGTKLGLTPESGYIFSAWGDYGGGPPFGFLSNLKFSTARDLYISTGKTEQQLKDWVLKMFQTSGKGSKSAPYAEKWVQGYEFKVSYSGGWVNPHEVAPGS
jgi:hypothetical protein